MDHGIHIGDIDPFDGANVDEVDDDDDDDLVDFDDDDAKTPLDLAHPVTGE